MLRTTVAIILLMLLCTVHAQAQEHVLRIPRSGSKDGSDTIQRHVTRRLSGNDTIYGSSFLTRQGMDSIQKKYSHHAITRLIYSTMFVRLGSDELSGKVIDETKAYEPFRGKRISHVEIVRLDLIGKDSTWLERTANSLHITTLEGVVRRDLLYHDGESLDPDLITKSDQRLRSRSYISNVYTEVEIDPSAADAVIVTVFTQDSWSVSVDGSFSMTGRTMLKLYDANFLGYGDNFGISNHFNWKDWSYQGCLLDVSLPNALGSMYTVDFNAGKAFENSTLGGRIRKDFILRQDYMAGASYYQLNTKTYLLYADSSAQVRSNILDVWAGKSIYMKGINSSFYLTGRFTQSEFPERPPVSRTFNPAFHDGGLTLFGVGLYRESFYSANLIYGFGSREYLATGYRAELVGGYLDGEFGGELYSGFNYSTGGFTKIGYFAAEISAGNYIYRPSNTWGRGAVKISARYFSNLWGKGRSRVRQFVELSHLHGWNRYGGVYEAVTFDGSNTLHAMDVNPFGTNRTRLSLETVVFTPFEPLGFRMAVFGYTDAGLLGNSTNPFRNQLFTTVGFGVRFKNERLIFNAVEIRLGLAIGPGGLLKSQYLTISNPPRADHTRFIPEPPKTVQFR